MSAIDVVAAAIVLDGKVLACRRSPGKNLAGYWELPGGKIEPGESHQSAVFRELQEELSIEATVGRVIASTSHPSSPYPINLHTYLIESFEGVITFGDSHDSVQWLAPDELDAVTWAPADVAVVAVLRSVL